QKRIDDGQAFGRRESGRSILPEGPGGWHEPDHPDDKSQCNGIRSTARVKSQVFFNAFEDGRYVPESLAPTAPRRPDGTPAITRTGIAAMPLSTAVSISIRTKSSGSSSRRCSCLVPSATPATRRGGSSRGVAGKSRTHGPGRKGPGPCVMGEPRKRVP